MDFLKVSTFGLLNLVFITDLIFEQGCKIWVCSWNSLGIAIGGDVFPGSTLSDHVLRFNNIPQVNFAFIYFSSGPVHFCILFGGISILKFAIWFFDLMQVKLIVVLGELGGRDEYSLVEALKQGKVSKPVVAWVSGTCARLFKSEVQFGHAVSCHLSCSWLISSQESKRVKNSKSSFTLSKSGCKKWWWVGVCTSKESSLEGCWSCCSHFIWSFRNCYQGNLWKTGNLQHTLRITTTKIAWKVL